MKVKIWLDVADDGYVHVINIWTNNQNDLQTNWLIGKGNDKRRFILSGEVCDPIPAITEIEGTVEEVK